MKTCDMPTGPESKRCGKVAVSEFIWVPNAGEAVRADAHACAEHDVLMGGILEINEKRAREWKSLPPASDADVLRHILSQ